MSGPPLFRADAKAFGEELAAVLRVPFPLEDAGFTWAEQVATDAVTYLEVLERVGAMVAGESRRVMAESLNVAAANPHPFDYSEHPEWSMYGEIALALGLAPMTAQGRIEDARRLHHFLPLTVGKLRAGELSVSKTFVMLEETLNLDAPECARVEADAMKNTTGTTSEFRARVRRIIAKIAPEALILKRKKARKEDVGVETYEGDNGLNAINALVPAEDAALGWKAITERAKELRAAGDLRPMNELLASAFTDLLVNRPDGTPRVTWQVQLIVPVGTVLGVSEDDGNIPGHGVIPADVARDIADEATEVQRLLVHPDTGTLLDATSTKYRPRIKKLRRILEPDRRGGPGEAPCRTNGIRDTCVHQPGRLTRVRLPGVGSLPDEVVEAIADDPEWQRLLTDPDTSERLDAHPDTYRPGIPLTRFIQLRDWHCRFPGCRRPAKSCDVDHTIPHGRPGGLTVRRNLACFCRRHHQIKQRPGWKVVQGDHGELTFTTPTGRIYRTRPPTAAGHE